MRRRPELTVRQLTAFLKTIPPKTKLKCAVSLINPDEPIATQEFIDHDTAKSVVSMDFTRGELTFGYKI